MEGPSVSRPIARHNNSATRARLRSPPDCSPARRGVRSGRISVDASYEQREECCSFPRGRRGKRGKHLTPTPVPPAQRSPSQRFTEDRQRRAFSDATLSPQSPARERASSFAGPEERADCFARVGDSKGGLCPRRCGVRRIVAIDALRRQRLTYTPSRRSFLLRQLPRQKSSSARIATSDAGGAPWFSPYALLAEKLPR